MTLTRLGTIALALAIVVGPLAAQAKNEPDAPGGAASSGSSVRHGLWGGIGLGYGSLGCSGCSGISGLSGNLRIGGTVNPGLSLGIGTFGFYHSESSYSLSQSAFLGLVDVYPSATSGFFFQAGVGYGGQSIDIPSYGSGSVSGFSDLLGAGIDVRTGRTFYLTPFLNYFQLHASGTTNSVLQFGLAATWH